MIRRRPRSRPTASRFPYTTLFRSMLHRFALPGRHAGDRLAQALRTLPAVGGGAGIVRIRMVVQRELVVQFAAVAPAATAQGVDRAAADRKSTRLNSSH